MSDHKIVLTVIEGNPVNRGSGYWKINNSVLIEPRYIQLIQNLVSDFKKQIHE